MNKGILKDLEILGLSPAEAQVYLILARKGPVKAGQIISDVKISSSNVHEALEKLAKKGVISFVVKNNVKEYNAVKPEMLRLIIDKEREELEYKESRLKFLIDEINSLEKSEKGNQNAEIFIGFNGLRNGFRKLLGNPLAGEEFVFFYNATEKDIKIVHEFFSKMDLEEDLRKIRTRALFSKNYSEFFGKRKSRIEAKFTDHPLPSSINVYRDKVLIIAWSENPVGFLIQSQNVADTFYSFFQDVWGV